MQMLISRKTVGPFIVSKGPKDPLKVVINGSPGMLLISVLCRIHSVIDCCQCIV